MNIITVITKRSLREVDKNKKFLNFFSSSVFSPGDIFEIIEANKKTMAAVVKIEDISSLKEQIRSGALEIKKLKFSKTGELKNGKVIENLNISEIKKYIKNPLLIQESENKNLKKIFPKKRKKILKQNCKEKGGKKNVSSISDLLKKTDILNRKKKYYSKMQEQVDTIRNYFGENSAYGYGSFSFYIGMFKQVPEYKINQFFAEVKQSRKTNLQKKKEFWFKIGKFIKEKNKKS